ncbi:lipopolysaccharide/colanic/teichoic acid biosynthesis glycosyltransferase [Mucilaginibacter phyllosphaerae]|nr:lipopolysaccharide/colanic/teichoic acid biosynthesis glycosyltransferase [Mucilaginibacter phyllosphaerae]
MIISAVLLIILLPVLIIVAILIKLDSAGPVLFKQIRIGHLGLPFQILKFRTMINRKPHEIDQLKEGVIKGNDSRITKLGAYLRASSLDELPQLINVLLGSMTFIGPRPILPEQKEVVPPQYQKRFSVYPGISGLAQVKGRRSLSWEDQLIFDCEYADRKSFKLDIYIMIRTVAVVFSKKDIYGAEGKNWRLYREEWKK